MNRRTFLKALAAVIATPVVSQLDALTKVGQVATAATTEYSKYIPLSHGVIIKKLGIVEVKTHSETYTAVRHHLYKRYPNGKVLEAYSDIDCALLDVVPNPDKFIQCELELFIEAMLQEERTTS